MNNVIVEQSKLSIIKTFFIVEMYATIKCNIMNNPSYTVKLMQSLIAPKEVPHYPIQKYISRIIRVCTVSAQLLLQTSRKLFTKKTTTMMIW